MKNSNLFLLLILSVLWGPSFLFIKVAVEDFPPLTLVAIRLTLAALLLFGFLRMSGRTLPSGWSFWGKFIVMGFFANALPFVLFSFGEQFTDSGVASILNGTTPIFTVVLAHFFVPDERLTVNRLSGVLIGFAGIGLIFLPDLLSLLSGEGLRSAAQMLGMLAFITASASYGVGMVYSRMKLRGLPPLVGPAAQLICSAAMVVPVALIVDRPFSLTPGLPAVLSAGILGIFGTAAAYLVFYRMLDTAGPTFISLVTYLLPPFGLVLGIIFLAERPGWYSFAGLALILLGVMQVNQIRFIRRASAEIEGD